MEKIAPSMIAAFKQVDASGKIIAFRCVHHLVYLGVIFLILVTEPLSCSKIPLRDGCLPVSNRRLHCFPAAVLSPWAKPVKRPQWVDALGHAMPQRFRRLGLISQHSPLAQIFTKKTMGLTGN